MRRLAMAVLGCACCFQARADTAAVLPFVNRSASPAVPQSATPPAKTAVEANVDWIGEGVAETVREALASRGILTIDRNEIQEGYRGLHLRERTPLSEASVMKIGEALDAEQVVFGAFAVSQASEPAASPSRSLRISARILDLRRLRLGPEFTETGALDDLATLEAHLAWRALTLLSPKLAPPESDFAMMRDPVRLDAEENYVRGLLASDPSRKEQYFVQASRLDSRFAHPCYQLGQIHYQRKEYRQAAEWLEKVGPGDIHFREASFLLGLARFRSEDYPGAEKAFQAILATVPLSEVYNNLAAAESRHSLPQALDDFRKALEGDPGDPVYLFNLGYGLWKKGDFAAAADRFRAVLDRDPEDRMATLLLGRCLKKQALRPGTLDLNLQNLERLKTSYEERAYWQLKSMLDAKKP